MKYRIAQIIPYFGNWPEWIELYFYSCGRNPMVDFIFYTDCPLPKHQYKNTIFHKCTFEDYTILVSERLGLSARICRPYKLTDLKPFLGYVHQEELKDYNFWGFGDLDLVYGDLSMLINDDMLDKYDLITSHSNRVAGHFTIVRNNDYYQNLCFKIKNWENGLTDEKHFSYDELAWTCLVNPMSHNIDRIYRYIMVHFGCDRNKLYDFLNKLILKRKYLQELYTTPIPQPQHPGDSCKQWIYDNVKNKIEDPENRELPYLHFMAFKKCQWVQTNDYWKGSYWQLDDDFEKYDKIIFDKDKVIGV